MRFYLQRGIPRPLRGWREVRLFLDDKVHTGATKVTTISAKTWIEARGQCELRVAA